MHPMFVKLFIEADADDLLAEEEATRRRVRRAGRNRPAAVLVRAAARDRDLQPRQGR
jgi:PHD/YefM family antitoxin component YafN of YafNO toxin-antitoxin module